jgi:hypothetical protein
MAKLFRVAFSRASLYFHLPIPILVSYVDRAKTQPGCLSEA